MEVGILSIQSTPADRAALAREARWKKLLDQVDPEGVMSPDDREDAARRLRREQLAAYGRLGRAKQAAEQAGYRAYVQSKDDLIRLHETAIDLLRGVV